MSFLNLSKTTPNFTDKMHFDKSATITKVECEIQSRKSTVNLNNKNSAKFFHENNNNLIETSKSVGNNDYINIPNSSKWIKKNSLKFEVSSLHDDKLIIKNSFYNEGEIRGTNTLFIYFYPQN